VTNVQRLSLCFSSGLSVTDCVFRLTRRAIFARKLVSCTLLAVSGVGIVIAGALHGALAVPVIMSIATLRVYLTATSYGGSSATPWCHQR